MNDYEVTDTDLDIDTIYDLESTCRFYLSMYIYPQSEKKKGLLSSLFDGKTEESRQVMNLLHALSQLLNSLQPPLNDERTSTTIGNGEQVDGENVDKAPPPIVISGKRSDKDKITKELLRQKTELEREKVSLSVIYTNVD